MQRAVHDLAIGEDEFARPVCSDVYPGSHRNSSAGAGVCATRLPVNCHPVTSRFNVHNFDLEIGKKPSPELRFLDGAAQAQIFVAKAHDRLWLKETLAFFKLGFANHFSNHQAGDPLVFFIVPILGLGGSWIGKCEITAKEWKNKNNAELTHRRT